MVKFLGQIFLAKVRY